MNCIEVEGGSNLPEEELWRIISEDKQLRSQFINNRSQLFKSLRVLSEQLKELRDNELEGTSLFASSLNHINEFLERAREG